MASTKSGIIGMLQDGQVWSGQALANRLGISRTAIWKQIEALKQDGYDIETVPRKGYRLQRFSDRLDDTAFAVYRKGRFGDPFYAFDEIDTTQRVAHELVQQNAPEGTLISAEEQTSGRGQLGRRWVNPKGEQLAFSLVLRPELPIGEAAKLTLVAASAFARALQRHGLPVQIKWPNDLLLDGKKVAGILTEMQAEGMRIQAIILGVGVNVNNERFAPEIADRATSLRLATGRHVNRAELLADLLLALEEEYALYIEQGFAPIRLRWLESAAFLGEHITWKTAQGTYTGTMVGIGEDGALLIESEGVIKSLYSAEIACWQD